jgi:hypothetical protein
MTTDHFPGLRACAVAVVTTCLWSSSDPTHAAATSTASSCSSAEHRQLDFWLGDWDVFDTKDNTKVVARVQVQSILNGCVLLETYSDSDGYEGRSFSSFDSTRNVWHQSWVTNRGQLLIIEGHFRSGVMELSGMDRATAGAHDRVVRATWQPVANGVHEVAARSEDNGRSWQPWFDLTFRPHAK